MSTEKAWYPGHIEKAKRVIQENVKAVQAVVEMTDARIPHSGRAYEWKSLFHNKKTVILLSKADLADPCQTDRWIAFYENQGIPAFALNLKGNPGGIRDRFVAKMTAIAQEQRFQRYMIVGIPNVGKSTLVNAILGKRKVRVGNTPGVTRGIQWVNITDQLMLMDTPGILYRHLFSKHVRHKLLLSGCIKASENEIDEALEYVFHWLKEYYPNYYRKITGQEIDGIFEFEQLLSIVGKKRGYLQKENRVDRSKVEDYLLASFQNGSFGGITYETPDILEGDSDSD